MRFTVLLAAGLMLAMSAAADGKARSLLPRQEIEPLSARAETVPAAPRDGYEQKIYRHGATYRLLPGSDASACEAACSGDDICLAWSFLASDGLSPARCELKRGAGRREENLLAVSGISIRPGPGIPVLPVPSPLAPNRTEELSAAARSGDGEAAHMLAKMYETGDGAARDIDLARFWTEQAARLGHRRSMHDLAVFMIEGEGGKEDINGAVEWFTRAAVKGEVDSQFNLALLLLSRADQHPDALAGALYWLFIAAGNGDVMAADKSAEVAALLPADMVDSIQAEASAFIAAN